MSLCNGQNTLDDIKKILIDHPNSDDAVLLIETLQKDGFFEPSIEKEIDVSPTLRSVHLNISQNCNLKCDYCYAEERCTDQGEPLSFGEYCKLIDELSEIYKCIEVAITGGEPLLNRHACEISKYCKSKGFYSHLLTNATMIDESNYEEIASSFDVIRVSLDGFTAERHDYHRGAGTFDKTVQAIALLKKTGVSLKIAMTVTKQNICDIQPLAAKYGNELTFQPLYNVGGAKGSDMAISGEEYFYALKNAKGVEPYAQIGQSLLMLKNRGTTNCAIGGTEISISHNGDVYPCHMLHLPEYCAGNIREQSIIDIYNNSSTLAKTRKITVHTREDCKSCPVRLLCGGSCRARALYSAGNLDAADTFCEYEFLAFTEGLIRSVELTTLDSDTCNGCNDGILCCNNSE